jgi:hypothetical protein
MAGSRQAWCPRCDELRAARPGAACPTCGRGLLAVPQARPTEPPASLAGRAVGRLGAALPALRAASTGLVVLAVVAGAFAAGRATRSTPATAPSEPATTLPGFAQAGPLSGRRDFNWRAIRSGITVTLRSTEVGGNFGRVALVVEGLKAGEGVVEVGGLRLQDGQGRDLVPAAELAALSPTSSRQFNDDGVDFAELPLDDPFDWRQVARVTVGRLTIGHETRVTLSGDLRDQALAKASNDRSSPQASKPPSSCPDCQVEVTCKACRTVRVIDSSYRDGSVLLVLAARGPLARSALQGSQAVVNSDAGGEISSWSDSAPDGTTAVGFNAADLAVRSPPGTPMSFQVEVTSQAMRTVAGPWTITQPGEGTPP